MKGIQISIIIPNYNGRDLLIKNLPSVLGAYKNMRNQILEIIVVDDASTDDSLEILQANFKAVRVIKHLRRKWFSSAVNSGAKVAKGNLLCLLNSDVSVKNNFLEDISSYFSDKNVFGVSLHERGYGGSKGKFVDGFIVHEPIPESTKAYETFWVSGGSGVFKREIWDKLGGMDEALLSPFYWEDMDLSYRAQKRGYRLLWEPDGYVIHEHEATIKKIDRKKVNLIWERNQLLFIWKNLTSNNLFRKHILGVISRTLKHPGYIKIVLMALLRLKLVLEKRRVEKRASSISDETIFSRFT